MCLIDSRGQRSELGVQHDATEKKNRIETANTSSLFNLTGVCVCVGAFGFVKLYRGVALTDSCALTQDEVASEQC